MILECKNVAESILSSVKQEVKELIERNIIPNLALVRVDGDDASSSYVKTKETIAKEVGISSSTYLLPNDCTNEDVMNKIYELNNDPKVHAIMLQLPLPKQLNSEELVNCIAPYKDVDCLSIASVGSLFTNNDIVQPCTPKGIMSILKYHNIDLAGKDALIINRSMLVGKPLVELLQRENATPQLAHSKTDFLKQKITENDITISAVGKPNFIKYDDLLDLDRYLRHVNRKLYIIDVSMNRNKDNKLCGDIEFNSTATRDKLKDLTNIYITPVPTGVGLTTVASLMENTIKLTKLNNLLNM